MKVEWAPEEIETLKACWSEGLTASEIADRLPGRSRNSVLGYVDRHRDQFAKRCKEGERANHAKRVRMAMVRIWGEPAERPAPPKRKPVKSAIAVKLAHRAKGSTRIASPAPMVMRPTLAEPMETAALPHGWERSGGAHRDLSRFQVPGVDPIRIDEVGSRQCRFILAGFHADDGSATQCCGAPAQPGKSWCADHMKLVWAKRRPKADAVQPQPHPRVGAWA